MLFNLDRALAKMDALGLDALVAGVARNVHYASGFWTRNFEWGSQEALAAVIIPRDRSVGLTAVAAKVASGAADSVPLVQVGNLVRALEALKEDGLWVVGASGETERDLYQTDLKLPLVMVMGAEGPGLRRLTRETCDLLMRIPMLGTVESLNLSTAAAVCLFEARRQRQFG